jgi:hypothetical protein
MFCESHEQQVVKRAEALQPIACGIIFADFSDFDADPHELRQEGHVFSRHFRQTEHCQDLPTGLQALVAAADVAAQGQTRSNGSDFATDISAQDPADGMNFQLQFPEIVTNMTGTEQHIFGSALLPHWQSGPRVESAGFVIDIPRTPPLHDQHQIGLPTVSDTGNWDYDNFFMNWGYD